MPSAIRMIWENYHLDRAIKRISGNNEFSNQIPILFCSPTILIDKYGNNIGKSKVFKKPPSFENALVQSIAGGIQWFLIIWHLI